MTKSARAGLVLSIARVESAIREQLSGQQELAGEGVVITTALVEELALRFFGKSVDLARSRKEKTLKETHAATVLQDMPDLMAFLGPAFIIPSVAPFFDKYLPKKAKKHKADQLDNGTDDNNEGEGEDDDEDEEEDEPEDRADGGNRLQPKRADEQLCPQCFLLVRASAPTCPVGDDACPIFS